jgi:hypothetical protein
MMATTQLISSMAACTSGMTHRRKEHTNLRIPEDSVVVRAGGATEAREYLRRWFEESVEDYLKVCDAYFGPEDLDLLCLLQSAKPECRVQIITSRKHLQDSAVPTPWEETFRTHWRRISDQSPPDVEIVVVGIGSSGLSPIHARWWISNGSGLRVDSSYNTLGKLRVSDISVLSPGEARQREEYDIDPVLNRTRREHLGERLTYCAFTL